MSALAVAVGAALGAMTRHGIARTGIGWTATLTANLSGSLLLGVLVAVGPTRTIGLAVGTGFCGALTTMSSLMLEAAERDAANRWRLVLVHLVPGLVLAGMGAVLGAAIAR